MPDNPYEHADETTPVELDQWGGESVSVRLSDYCRRCGKLDMNQDHMRVYCPRCAEVTCGGKRQGDWMAFPHYRNGPKGRMDRIPCIGGPIDPKEDRAP